MKRILIVGGSGSIGQHLTDHLVLAGHEVSILSRTLRSEDRVNWYTWNPSERLLDAEALKKKDVIINLSGAGIAEKRWTSKRKKILYNSRIESTRLLVDALIEHNIFPELVINASAIGYYGNRPGEELNESSEPGQEFLSEICVDWEKEVRMLEKTGINYAILRLGIVLSEKGGSFPKLRAPLKVGLNILFGKGDQFLSWIHIDDLINIISSLISKELPPGVYNCTSSNPVSQKEFNAHFLKATHSVALPLNIPERILVLFLGEMSALVTADLNVIPENLVTQGFRFLYPDLKSSIEHLINS